ncbi:acetylornithine carbamoyltransferase [Flavobacterium branchiophilum NBRC 15030 = ATCC 35035]|uniref:N-succinylornithine carbamoyltransferase n=1 Tax=Flavobacterium branchiophilum TaxID=55197 RepID=A0A543FZV1_9FLAO|nr:N-acetylornithine carbamoyltransferase [Flavobacterium branchiophilum]OXA73056.1 acetylornithine carbamoyltransferase [Flavobacterium branchiophilum NBRC 15030 = ATCC 35035]TQM39357.1 ornithine carbamoyltransferase [Flavobacterium branchiophilum]GEM56659.1 N-acetylornithine carbamoyltransferase [Flavobacterium branchiophilum NBRC 15030 = ATCC 35035]
MNFTTIQQINNLEQWVKEALKIKKNPLKNKKLGKNKTLGMLFFNPSLRTRLSTQKAALNLGMNVIVMNFNNEGWTLEFEDGAIMNQGASEHIKEAAEVVSQYCDIIAIRAFAGLVDKEKDQAETVMSGFLKYATVPIVNMESATGHPLQSLADAITMAEHKTKHKPKVVLSWAPHPKALPQAVPNSFVEMMLLQEADFVITHPEGYELDPSITKNATIEYNQNKAFENADFIYAKNWSNFTDYGKITNSDPSWTINAEKMKLTNNAKFMHCLPVRRNVIVADEVLDSNNAIVIEQANNRTFAAQLVLQKILKEVRG